MGRKSKLSYEDRLKMVKEYLEEDIPLMMLSKKYIYTRSKILLMISRFNKNGSFLFKYIDCFIIKNCNKGQNCV